MAFLVDLQRWINGAVSDELTAFEATRNVALLFGILPLGIALGAVHAFTPGHGKMVLASYVAGSRAGVARSLIAAFTLSATHVASAVLLALVGTSLLSRTLVGAGQSELIASISGGLVALVGVWLVVRAVRSAPHVHGEGMAVGMAAGLVPCPLTLFAMMYAISRGVPEAGLAFAVSMLIGITLTLAAVAVATALARDRAMAMAQNPVVFDRVRRASDAVAGMLLVALGLMRVMQG